MATLVTCVWHLLQAYYLKAHSGRKLTWQTNMGSADLKAVFGSKRHELNVSTYQVHNRGMHCTSVPCSHCQCRLTCSGTKSCLMAAGLHPDAVQRVRNAVLQRRVSSHRHPSSRAQAEPAVTCLRQGECQLATSRASRQVQIDSQAAVCMLTRRMGDVGAVWSCCHMLETPHVALTNSCCNCALLRCCRARTSCGRSPWARRWRRATCSASTTPSPPSSTR